MIINEDKKFLKVLQNTASVFQNFKICEIVNNNIILFINSTFTVNPLFCDIHLT